MLRVWCRFFSDDLLKKLCESNHPGCLSEGSGTCDPHTVCPIHYKVQRKLGNSPWLCRVTSAQPMIGSTIWEFFISIALKPVGIEVSVLCLFTETESIKIDLRMLWRTAIGGTVSIVLCRLVFYASYCTWSTLNSVFPLGRKSWTCMLISSIWWLARSPGVRVKGTARMRDIGKVRESCDLWGSNLM